jgi:hypothetical protein
MINGFKNLSFKYLRFITTYCLLLKHIFALQFRQPVFRDKVAVIYIMRKKIYFQMALICISSFLFFNRDYKVIVYCDSNLHLLCKTLPYLFRTQEIEVRNEIKANSDPMLEQVRMFSKTASKNTILMDADIRWTGSLGYDFTKPLVYNVESDIGNDEAWTQLKSFLILQNLYEHLTFTCCITSLGNNQLKYSASEIDDIIERTLKFDWKATKLLQDRFHIRGQVLISHFISELGVKPDMILAMQKEFGQPILETSFYGATGYRYGL